MRLIYNLPNSQGGEDQTIQHYTDRLKKGPEPLSRVLLPFHISLCLVEKPLEIYLNFLFGGEKVLGQDSRWSIFVRELDDHISLKE